ncbi:sucrose-6-phosphate hydrolase [Pantoea sp. B65]|uniref:sucrose-6-phosphate hydrolase n=1 Tax=Pantoea sp. B65 TaxID=2813359 RepID=UPI0039B51995
MSEQHLLKQTLRAVMVGQQRAAADEHRPLWHLAPPVGLMNDPNGFIQFKQRYHLCYQWNPLACAHGAKYWGHWSSADLVNWQHEPLALAPAEEYESHGCYSGSAVDNDGVLTLIYTGNVKFDRGRTAWQCLATLNEQGEFDKQGPVLPLPAGYTGHVRDPKVWRHQDQWWMVLGAQDLSLQGKVLLLQSADLKNWILKGEMAGSGLGGLGPFGYMWECPDLFRLAGRDILVVCPQGLAAEAQRYLNTFQSGYFSGELDYASGSYQHGEFHELDHGFEFYAPQTTASDDGRRLLIGWMGVPDQDEFCQPTVAQGWIHTMTCPRELSWQQGKLFQRPARELQQLRSEPRLFTGVADSLPKIDIGSVELALQVDGDFSASFGGILQLNCDAQGLILTRTNRRTGAAEQRFWSGKVTTLQILCDRSSVEIFINQGEAVMSSRYFPGARPQLCLQGNGALTLHHWRLKRCVIE